MGAGVYLASEASGVCKWVYFWQWMEDGWHGKNISLFVDLFLEKL